MCLYLSCALTFSMVDKDKCVLYNFIPPLQLSSLHPVCSPPSPLLLCHPPSLFTSTQLAHSFTYTLPLQHPHPQPQVVLPCITLYYKLLNKIVIQKWVLIS